MHTCEKYELMLNIIVNVGQTCMNITYILLSFYILYNIIITKIRIYHKCLWKRILLEPKYVFVVDSKL